jgi:uncharacterized membrane protein HdeD (DUF308 family)
MTLILGVLFVMLKGGVVGIAIKVFAAVLIITAVIELIKLKIASGVVKAILAVVLLIFGWAITEIALLVIGIVLIVFGVLELVKRIVALFKKNRTKLFAKILGFISPVFSILAGYFLITSSGKAVDWAIIVGGILLIINGVLALIEALASKK